MREGVREERNRRRERGERKMEGVESIGSSERERNGGGVKRGKNERWSWSERRRGRMRGKRDSARRIMTRREGEADRKGGRLDGREEGREEREVSERRDTSDT